MFKEKDTIIYQEKESLEILEKPFIEIKLYDDNGKIIQEVKEGYKSELRVGNIYIRFTKKFNWFQRLMLKWVFGLNIYNI
ncbi:MAG: hypothetical protein IJV94_03405 [Bacilli bacterium]|nr:hypothetical protein [Bacilli bacterium]